MSKKFRKGQRVVPKSWKRGDLGATLDRSKAWNDAKKKGQPYLWITDNIYDVFHIRCDSVKDSGTGDYFYHEDLEPYVESKTSEIITHSESFEWAGVWEPTMNLRWRQTGFSTTDRTLEQLWKNNQGKFEWRKIPTV